ncbi:MAG: GDCCVxC domain-containing (seleno)protein [Flavisolibacter sp.]
MVEPRKGDCCVFCGYGMIKCPPVQSGVACCR